MPEKIRVVSCDYDGCLCHSKYFFAQGEDKDIVKHNRALNEGLEKHAASFSRTTFIIGSNRQSKRADDAGQLMNERDDASTGSCFGTIKTLSEHHHATFDPFLMADIYGNLPDGESFRRATDSEYHGDHANCIIDTSKLTLLYAQIHKLANENPDKHISFEFYDDKLDIIQGLYIYFSLYPKLIPANVDLCMKQYAGIIYASAPTLRGKGFIDSHFKETVLEMTEMAGGVRPSMGSGESLEPINGIIKVRPQDLVMPQRLDVDLSFMNILESEERELSDGESTPPASMPPRLERQLAVEYVPPQSFFGQASTMDKKEDLASIPIPRTVSLGN